MFANLAPTLTLGPNNLTRTLKIDIKIDLKTLLVMGSWSHSSSKFTKVAPSPSEARAS